MYQCHHSKDLTHDWSVNWPIHSLTAKIHINHSCNLLFYWKKEENVDLKKTSNIKNLILLETVIYNSWKQHFCFLFGIFLHRRIKKILNLETTCIFKDYFEKKMQIRKGKRWFRKERENILRKRGENGGNALGRKERK